MLSSKAKYALRAAAHLAERFPDETWTLTSEIAEQAQIPRKFLEAILVELRDAGLLDSQRGRYGGYRLARAPAAIHVGELIRAIDGPLALTPCTSRTAYGPCADCVNPAVCALRPVLQQARDAVAEVLDGQTLADLRKQGQDGNNEGGNNEGGGATGASLLQIATSRPSSTTVSAGSRK